MDKAKQDEPWSASMGLLRDSPLGLLHCAKDWMISAKTQYGFDHGSPALAAVRSALAGAPDIFIGSRGPAWGDSPRYDFWLMYFQARKDGADMGDFESIIKGVDKKELARGAKDMMIMAAQAKDERSFESMLGLGAARRSKLLLFSAYKHGGKTVAEKVKKPTEKEAEQLLALGASGSPWRSAREVSHDWAGLRWLVELSRSDIEASVLAKIGANSSDPRVMAEAVREFGRKISVKEHSFYMNGQNTKVSLDEAQRLAVVSMCSAGHPEAGKLLALDRGGEALWRDLCEVGFRRLGILPVKGACPSGRGGDVTIGERAAWPMTVQAATALSGSMEACAWLRAEYESLGTRWLSAQALGKIYAGVVGYHRVDQSPLVEKALALSEVVDLRCGLGAVKTKTKTNRAKAL